MTKNLPAVQKPKVLPLGWEDPLEKEVATHSHAWDMPWTEEPGSPRGGKELDMTEQPNNNKRRCWAEKPQGLVVESLDHLLHTRVRD